VLDIHGTGEGPELITNGRFTDTAEPWFTWVQKPENASIVGTGDELRVDVAEADAPWSVGMGQYVRAMRPGARYRLAFQASNEGGEGQIQAQIGVDGREQALPIVVAGREAQGLPVDVGPEMGTHTVEFLAPRDADLSTAKLLFLLGGFTHARIDNVSLREIVGADAASAE
jgi:hypothetical protein